MSSIIAKTAWNVSDAYFYGDTIASISPYGCGHIQDTYLVITHDGESADAKYILQRLNRNVFPHPVIVMENICAVTDFIRGKLSQNGRDSDREVLKVIPTRTGQSYHVDDSGEYWRLYNYVDDTITHQLPDSARIFEEAARAFGDFQLLLADFPAETLHETIPHFHDTPARAMQLETAVNNNAAGRLASVDYEISFARARYEKAGMLMEMLRDGLLPLRVTHNDTKLNNVLMDASTGKATCIVDLDTVMPGLVAHDFGDAIRFGANTAMENEPDLAKVSLDLHLFEAYVRGYLRTAGHVLKKSEIETLPLGAWAMTLEVGMRFLADYLNGDVYFKIHYPDENLVRARCQFALAQDIERKEKEMVAIINRYAEAV